MAGLTPAHLVLILIIALIVIGPGKLPELGAAVGKSLKEFQKAAGQITDPQQPAPLAPPVQQYWAPQPQIQPMQVPPAPYYAPLNYAPQTPGQVAPEPPATDPASPSA
jgi:TatA/E family protein of Tat protein translocase